VAGITKGAPWGRAQPRPADVEVAGDDADLAAALAGHPGGIVAWTPVTGSDLARTLGLAAGVRPAPGWVVPLDVLRIADRPERPAANAVVLGAGPGTARRRDPLVPCTVRVDGRDLAVAAAIGVVVANGPFLDGARASLRAHPGDGRLDVLVVALAPGQRREMRRRLATASHLPHPDLLVASGRVVEVVAGRTLALTVDGRVAGMADRLTVRLDPAVAEVVVGPPAAGGSAVGTPPPA
jgi:diacylglycerol kinase family enzyme